MNELLLRQRIFKMIGKVPPGVRQIALKDMQSAILALPSPDSNVNSLIVVF